MKKDKSAGTVQRRINAVCVPIFWRAIVAELIGTLLVVTLTSGTLRMHTDKPEVLYLSVTTNGPQLDFDHVGSKPNDASEQMLLILQHLYLSCATGSILCVITLCLSAVCSTYFNPALCLSALLTRRATMVQACCFILAQCAGSVTGAAIAYGATTDAHSPVHLPDFTPSISSMKLLTVEALATFLFTLAYFASVDRGHGWTASQRAMILGVAATGAHMFSAPYTGTSINPAKCLGPAIVRGNWQQHWVYWVGPILGACTAAFMYEFVFATNASVNKGVCFLQSSRYNPDDKIHCLPLIKTKCRCEEKCLNECTRIQAYESYMRRQEMMNSKYATNERQTKGSVHNYNNTECNNVNQLTLLHRNDSETYIAESLQYHDTCMEQNLPTNQYLSPRYKVINEHSGICNNHRSVSDWRMTSLDSNVSSSMGDNISLDQSMCEERVSVI